MRPVANLCSPVRLGTEPRPLGVAMDRESLQTALREARAAAQRGRPEAAALLRAVEESAMDTGEAEPAEHARIRRLLLQGNGEAAAAGARRLVDTHPESADALSLATEVCRRVRPPERSCALYVVGSAAAFRRLGASLPQPTEAVLELGCANGRATVRLARSARVVYAVEKGEDMLRQAREWVGPAEHVQFLQLDVREAERVRVYVPEADLIFLDIGGSSPFWQVVELGQRYRALFRPRALILRCVYLNDLIGSVATFEPPTGRGPWSRLRPPSP